MHSPCLSAKKERTQPTACWLMARGKSCEVIYSESPWRSPKRCGGSCGWTLMHDDLFASAACLLSRTDERLLLAEPQWMRLQGLTCWVLFVFEKLQVYVIVFARMARTSCSPFCSGLQFIRMKAWGNTYCMVYCAILGLKSKLVIFCLGSGEG